MKQLEFAGPLLPPPDPSPIVAHSSPQLALFPVSDQEPAPPPKATKRRTESPAGPGGTSPLNGCSLDSQPTEGPLSGLRQRPSPTELGGGSSRKPTIRGKIRVEGILRRLIGPKVMVTLTENRSTMVSCAVKKGVTYVRLHAFFADAPEHVLGAVAEFIAEPRPSRKAEWLIDRWIEAHRPAIRRPNVRIQPQGETHDLQNIFDQLNALYFRSRICARITWSTAAKKQKRSSIRMGSYSEDEKLIRIHPALDQSFVPEFFVASVVFHEMLHQLHGAHEDARGTRRVHTPAFRRDEAKFQFFEEARAWEARHIRKLLNY